MNADTDRGPGGAPVVDKATCDQMREAYKDGYSLREIELREWVPVKRRAVRYHVSGECGHSGNEPAAEMRGNKSGPVAIHPFECAALRLLGSLNYHPQVLAFLVDFETVEPVLSHIRGECGCDSPVDPVPNYRREDKS